MIAAVRLARWQPWLCRDRADLIGLAVGYAWVAAGLLVIGYALLAGRPTGAAMHALTVGGLGSLSIGVMARVLAVRCRRDPARMPWINVALALISTAAILRVFQPLPVAPSLIMAAACWTAAYLLLLRELLIHEPLLKSVLRRAESA